MRSLLQVAAILRRRCHLPISPVFWTALIIVMIWVSVAYQTYTVHTYSLRAATATADDLAHNVGESVNRTVAGVDQIIEILRNAYAADPAGFNLSKLAPSDQTLDAVTLQIATTDEHGMMTASNLSNAKLVDLADRTHVQMQMQSGADQLYISSPVLGRTSNLWSLQFTRKMFAPDGAMAGVLIMSLDPGHFVRFAQTLEIGQGSVTLIGIDDGIVRAHEPAIANDIGQTASDFALQHIRGEAKTGTFEMQDQFDGVSRIYSYRRLDKYGMAVVAGLATDDVFAHFRFDLRRRLIAGSIVTLLVLLVGTQLSRQRQRLISSQAHLSATLETMDQGIMMVGPDGRAPVINRRAIELLGLPATLLHSDLSHGDILRWQIANGEFGQAKPFSFDPTVDVGEDIGVIISGKSPIRPGYERSRPDGTILEVRTQSMQGGGAVRSFTDVTARRHAEQHLQQAQTRLGRAQQMEAIGQLTGGIAHDFNNLLAVVVGNLDMLTEETEEGSDPRLMVTEALRAALRGSSLVNQLLAFARKLPLKPQTVDINQLTADMVSLLSRTLGGAINVTLHKDPKLWLVMADPSQLENAILNLAINARDAMPEGGTLELETSCVTLSAAEIVDLPDASPGDHVVLSVTDTGTGMSLEVQARAFDPFFTTKTDGKGTGLGLSMVYGFTRQSGGHVVIDSKPGIGTTVRLYLPRGRDAWLSDSLSAASNASLPHGHEVVLVVDDNFGVRETAARILRSLNYVVLEADSGSEALEILARTPKIDLLFTDVIMPGGIDGPMLARMATQDRPELAVLLTSGYVDATGDALHLGLSQWDMLAKPYRRQELAIRVRDALDQHNI